MKKYLLILIFIVGCTNPINRKDVPLNEYILELRLIDGSIKIDTLSIPGEPVFLLSTHKGSYWLDCRYKYKGGLYYYGSTSAVIDYKVIKQ